MRPMQARTISPKLAALALAALTTLNLAWAQPIPEGKPLTPAQEASIQDEMTALAPVLIDGGKTPRRPSSPPTRSAPASARRTATI